MPLLQIDDPTKPEKSLTPAKIAQQIQPPPRGKKTVYWVRGVGVPGGFGLLVHPPSDRWAINAVWIAQVDMPSPSHKTCRVNIGRYGQIEFKEALAEATRLRDDIRSGVNPNLARKRQRDITMAQEQVLTFSLSEAFEVHLSHLRRHGSPTTVKTLEYEINRYLGDWLERPLAGFKPAEMAARHEHITDLYGSRVANKALKHIRAAWNRARGRHRDLPPNILTGTETDRGFAYNAESFGGPSIAWRDLPDWWAKLQAVTNPVRQDLQVFGLLTGLRRNDCITLCWDDVDLEDGTIHRGNPKGGEAKAFTVPVSAFVLDLLQRRREQNSVLFGNDGGWVFPTDRVRGQSVTHIREMKEHRYIDGKKRKWLPSPHELRRTFGSACIAAGVTEHAKHILMNHRSRRGNVGDRYVVTDQDDLRAAAEAVTAFLLQKAGVPVSAVPKIA